MLDRDVTTATAANSVSVALRADDSLLVWGDNSTGALGTGAVLRSDGPVAAGGITRVDVIGSDAASNHSLVVREDGSTWGWGRSEDGQLGGAVRAVHADAGRARVAGRAGSADFRSGALGWPVRGRNRLVLGTGYLGDGPARTSLEPVAVDSLAGIVAIASGSSFTIALDGEGLVSAWGNNFHGSLGDGTESSRATPGAVALPSPATAIAAGYRHALAVLDGRVWGWGINSAQQILGDPIEIVREPVEVPGIDGVAAVAAGPYDSFALHDDGGVSWWGALRQPRPTRVDGLTGVASIAAGEWGLALDEGGVVWEIRLGRATRLSGVGPVAAIAGGHRHFLALLEDATAWGLGLARRGPARDRR